MDTEMDTLIKKYKEEHKRLVDREREFALFK